MPTRFTADINRLRAALRGMRDGAALTATLQTHVERLPAAALAANNSGEYVASNDAARQLTGYAADELHQLTVLDATPRGEHDTAEQLWQDFIRTGEQRGEYELRRKDGAAVRVRYWAYASVAPGLHVSLLIPEDPKSS